MKYSNMG